jgi:predicted nucleotidyltransferase
MHADFLELLKRLAESGLEFVIVGGVAARLHGGTRLTHDVDIVPRIDATAWARAIDALWDAGSRPRIPEPQQRVRDVDCVKKWIAEKGMLALSFHSADGFAEVDLLVGETERFAGLRERAVRVEVDGQVFWVAHIDDLISMKENVGRPQDLLDVEELHRIKERVRLA